MILRSLWFLVMAAGGLRAGRFDVVVYGGTPAGIAAGADEAIAVKIANDGADGIVSVDAVQLLPLGAK